MDDVKQQQKEALITAYEYMERLFAAIPKVCGELRSGMLPDTQEYLNAILNGVNFVTEVFNRTMDYVNDGQELVNKEELNEYVIKFMEEYKKKSPLLTADALENYILVYLKKFYDAIEIVCKDDLPNREAE